MTFTKRKKTKVDLKLERTDFLKSLGFRFDSVWYLYRHEESGVEITTEFIEHFIYDNDMFKELITERIEHGKSIQ